MHSWWGIWVNNRHSSEENPAPLWPGWIEVPGITDGEALAASIPSAMAGTIAVAGTVSYKRLSDDVLEAARETGLSEAAFSGGTVR